MSDATYTVNHERTLTSLVAEIKDEIKGFIQTRVEMFRAELSETLESFKLAAPLGAIAAVFLGTAFVLLSFSLAGLIAVAFWDNPYKWFFSFLIVGFLWLCVGGVCGALAIRRLQQRGMFPKKSMQVLKEDKIWLQTEARTQI